MCWPWNVRLLSIFCWPTNSKIKLPSKNYKQKIELPSPNIYVAYEMNLWPSTQGANFALVNVFFQAVKLAKNADLNEFIYFVYGIGFDVRGGFVLSNSNGFCKNVIIFGADKC